MKRKNVLLLCSLLSLFFFFGTVNADNSKQMIQGGINAINSSVSSSSSSLTDAQKRGESVQKEIVSKNEKQQKEQYNKIKQAERQAEEKDAKRTTIKKNPILIVSVIIGIAIIFCLIFFGIGGF